MPVPPSQPARPGAPAAPQLQAPAPVTVPAAVPAPAPRPVPSPAGPTRVRVVNQRPIVQQVVAILGVLGMVAGLLLVGYGGGSGAVETVLARLPADPTATVANANPVTRSDVPLPLAAAGLTPSATATAPAPAVSITVATPESGVAAPGTLDPSLPLPPEPPASTATVPAAAPDATAPGTGPSAPVLPFLPPPPPLPTAAASALYAASVNPQGGFAYALPLPGRWAYLPHHDNSPAVDIPAGYGTPIYAVTGGVTRVSVGGGGNQVHLRGDDGLYYLYLHLAAPGFEGRVTAGQHIGYVGSTGHSTGPHLHFAISDQAGPEGWGDFRHGALGGSGNIYPQPFLQVLQRTADAPVFVRGYHETRDNGCVDWTAAWSDGTTTSVPRTCPAGLTPTRNGTPMAAATPYPEQGAEGCTWYVAQWADGQYTRAPYACPSGMVLARTATPETPGPAIVSNPAPPAIVAQPPRQMTPTPAPLATAPVAVAAVGPTVVPGAPAVNALGTPIATAIPGAPVASGAASTVPGTTPGAAAPAAAIPTVAPGNPAIPGSAGVFPRSIEPAVAGRSKMGVGVYASSGGHLLDAMVRVQPGVILLMDPEIEFARAVRRQFPNAFIVGRRYFPQQPIDNPERNGIDAADHVAQLAVPLRGVVDAWMSNNEVVATGEYARYVQLNAMQTAFARRLQDGYGIPAVAGNNAPGVVAPEDYARYFESSIRESRYFGIHAYAPKNARSLADDASWYMLRYRRIHDALSAAGIPHGPMIITESGPLEGWRNVIPQEVMADQFIWYTRELEKDSYVIGHAIFGIFGNGLWQDFDLIGGKENPIVDRLGLHVR